MSGLDGRFVSDLSDLSGGGSQETRHMGARKRSRFIIAGALLAIALLICALVVLGVLYAAAISGGGGGENGTRIGSADKDTARNPLTLLFFEEKDDIDSITIQADRFMAEFFLPDEALLWMNEAGDYIVQLKNKNLSIILAEANDRITVVSSEKDEKDIVISAASLDRSLTVLKGMIHTRGDQFPKSLSRVRSDGARMTIATYYAGTTILTRKYEPELKLFLRHKPANSAAAAAADPQQGKLWEELLIRPETLHVSGVNSFGSLFFQEGEDVHVNSTADGNFSGSPFARKFGRVANENATLDVVFAANDSCGRARLVDRRGGADGGGELWLALAERAGGLRDASGRSALVLKDGALIEAHDGNESLRVHLHNATVDAKNAQDSGDGANCSAPARTWHAPAASVAIERCASSRDSDDAPRRASNVTNAAGAIRVATNTLHNRYAFERGDGDALAECYADWHYAIIDAGAVGARLGCGHRMRLAPASLVERYAVEMSAGFFEINAAPAHIRVSGSGATILAMSAEISIAPLKGAFE